MSNIIRSAKTFAAVREISIKPYTPEQTESIKERDRQEENFQASESAEVKAQEKAKEILRQAEEKAKAMEEELAQRAVFMEGEWERVRQAAEKEGYDAGFSAGEAQAQAIYESQVNHAQQILETAQADLKTTLEHEQPLMIELATALATRILGTVLNEEKRMQQFLSEILYEVKEYQFVKVYVHPEWFDRLHHCSEELQAQMSACHDFKIVPDIKLQVNECIVMTNAGKLDASLDTQLDQLKKQLHQLSESSAHVETVY